MYHVGTHLSFSFVFLKNLKSIFLKYRFSRLQWGAYEDNFFWEDGIACKDPRTIRFNWVLTGIYEFVSARYQIFAQFWSDLDRPRHLNFTWIFASDPVRSVIIRPNRPVLVWRSLISYVLVEMQTAIQSFQNFQRSSILNVVIWFSMQLDILVLIFVHFRALSSTFLR